MAIGSRAIQTRLAITVNARYYPAEGLSDGFYIDGRIPGKREVRGADLTIDREDKSFLLSVFARPAIDPADESWVGPLQSVGKQIKSGASDIDTEINNLAELAVEVTGRSTLKAEEQRQPFFSGLVVMGGEVAAVTIGEGCAYLYRNDVIYPLTRDEFPMEAIDYNGNAIDSLDDYIAGAAGTIRYSNIAQLDINDCIILCNLPVMEAVGQREMLRLLYEAEDQSDAAGMIMTQASAKSPGVPLQIAIGFVESVTAEEKTGRLNLGRFATGAVPVQKPAQTNVDTDMARTQRFHSSSMSNLLDEQDRMYKVGGEAKAAADDIEPAEAGFKRPQANEMDKGSAEQMSEDTNQIPLKEGEMMARDDYDNLPGGNYPNSVDDLYTKANDDFDDYQDYSGDEQIQYQKAPDGRNRYDDLGSTAPSSRKYGRPMEDDNRYGDDYGYGQHEPSSSRPSLFGKTDRGKPSRYSGHDNYDDYSHDPYDPYGDYSQDYAKKERTKRIIFYAVFGILILVCIFALIKLLSRGDSKETELTAAPTLEQVTQDDDTLPTITLPADVGPDIPPEEPTDTPEVTEPQETDPPEMEYVDHKVASGDTLWGLAKKYFPNADRYQAIYAIMDANGWDDMESTTNLRKGHIIKIPKRLD